MATRSTEDAMLGIIAARPSSLFTPDTSTNLDQAQSLQ